jgi:hypothetical protein
MNLDLRKAAQLCTERELALVKSASGGKLKALSAKRLELQISRARGLRDRFRDLAHRQKREAIGKVAPRGMRPARGNARTVEKEELFREVLQRFEARAEKLRASEAPVSRPRKPTARRRRASGALAAATPPPGISRRPVAKATTKRSTEPSPNRSARRQSAAALPVRKEKQIERSQAPRVQAHVGSRNRRSQARRDAR